MILTALPGWNVSSGAFPVVQGTNTSGTSGLSQVNSFAVLLPSSIQSGELLLILVAIADDGARTLTTPSGWTQLFNVVGPGNLRRFAGYYKSATGSEGASVTVAASSEVLWATQSFRISGFSGTPQAATATGTSATPNPPTLSPSGGSGNILWLAAEADRDVATPPDPTPPTNYGDQLTFTHSLFAITGVRVSSARRQLVAASEDPGTFAVADSGDWVAATIAVRGT